MGVLTVISWFSARKGRRALHDIVGLALRERPAILAVLSDQYTSEISLRPWAPLAERFGDRLDFILAAEWPQAERERDGQALLHRLGATDEVAHRMLRDQGQARTGLLLRQKRPAALVDLFFVEKGRPLAPTQADPREPALSAAEDALFVALDKLITRAPQLELRRPVEAGEHDYGPAGICAACGDGRASFRPCPGKKKDEGEARDRFELIELD